MEMALYKTISHPDIGIWGFDLVMSEIGVRWELHTLSVL